MTLVVLTFHCEAYSQANTESPKQITAPSDLQKITGTWKAEIEYRAGKYAKLKQYLTIEDDGQWQVYVNKKKKGWAVWTEINPEHQVMLQGDTHIHHERRIYKYFTGENELIVVELAYYQDNDQPIPPKFALSTQDLLRIDKVQINESLREFSKNLSCDILPDLDFRTGTSKLETAEKRIVTVTVYKPDETSGVEPESAVRSDCGFDGVQMGWDERDNSQSELGNKSIPRSLS